MMAAGGAAMPWKETCVRDQRLGFIVACLEGEESVAVIGPGRPSRPAPAPNKP